LRWSAVEENTMYKRALVPLDGSPMAESIIPFLTEIAGPLDMSITLLRVLEPITTVATDFGEPVVVDDLRARTRDAEEYLAPLAAMLRARGIDVSWCVRRGRPDAEILEAAREASADLIAMSTHGRSGVGRLLFGSVAEQVLRHADVPVFMMRATAPARPASARSSVMQTGAGGPKGMAAYLAPSWTAPRPPR
jgi:nucleotide-binding universal stress UspA family protein